MHVSKLTLIFSILLCSTTQIHTSLNPTVKINCSQIKGHFVEFRGHELHQYLGIPYAQPPIGSLRFKKPVPFTEYSAEFKAFENPPACMQHPDSKDPSSISGPKNEDCLYLNIWTPADASSSNKKAVMYWIHGGGFRTGSIRKKLYSGVPLAALGDVIVVTVNYRLGPFGFLYSGSDEAPGNVGLWDVLEGLKWINKHIESFGGDVRRITISGESSGSRTVGLFTTSPLARGLYSRLIMQSESPITRILDVKDFDIELAQKLATMVECSDNSNNIEFLPKQVVQCLRDVDAFNLSRADFILSLNFASSFLPHFGDDLLPSNPRTTVLEGDFLCEDLLIGNNEDEAAFELTFSDPERYGSYGHKNPHINRTEGVNTIQSFVSPFPDSESIVNHYLPADFTDDSRHQIRKEVTRAIGDVLQYCPNAYYAEKCAEQKRNVYYYWFNHRPSLTSWAEWVGVTHFDEVQFVFGQPLLRPDDYQESEVMLSEQMIEIWSSFVKFGKPSIPWPLYSRENRTFKFLGPEIVTGENGESGPHSENCDFLRPYFE